MLRALTHTIPYPGGTVTAVLNVAGAAVVRPMSMMNAALDTFVVVPTQTPAYGLMMPALDAVCRFSYTIGECPNIGYVILSAIDPAGLNEAAAVARSF
jgi:hypothetical protein